MISKLKVFAKDEDKIGENKGGGVHKLTACCFSLTAMYCQSSY